jgi:hypothetical protein
MLCLGSLHLQWMVDSDGETMNEMSHVPGNEDAAGVVPAEIPFVPPVTELEPVMHVVLDDVQGIVTRVISSSRAAGRDYVDQCRLAAQAVIAVRPDLSMQETLKAIFRMREMEEVGGTTLNAA